MFRGLRTSMALLLTATLLAAIGSTAFAQEPTPTPTEAAMAATATTETMEATATTETMEATAVATEAMAATAAATEAMTATSTTAGAVASPTMEQPAQLPKTGTGETLPTTPAWLLLGGIALLGLGLMFRRRYAWNREG